MTDFDFDCKEKKRIAAGAYHKKNGSKSKGCKLPSDYLTVSQKKKLNGEVKSMNLDRPMEYKEFKKMSTDHQKLYLQHLVDTYDPSMNDVRKMLQCSSTTIGKVFEQLGVKSTSSHPTRQHKEIWKAFCNGVVGGTSAPAIAESDADKKLENVISEVVNQCTETPEQIRFERDFYKARYFELISKLIGGDK